MRIAVFSNINGNLEALEAILESINKNNIKTVFCLGDVIGNGPNPKECLDLIINNKINLLLGNSELRYLKGVNSVYMTEQDNIHYNWLFNQLNHSHKQFLEDCKSDICLRINGYRMSFRHFLITDSYNPYPFHHLKTIRENKINNIDDLEDYVFIGHDNSEFIMKSKNTTLIDVR